MSHAKTSTQHRKAGTYRADQHGNRPDVKPGAPDAPQYLSKAALAEWRRVIDMLVQDIGVCPLDMAVLALYCQAWADVGRLTAEIADEGETIETPNGALQRSPKCISLREARETVLKTAAKLGLSPIDRTKPIPPRPDKQPGIDEEMTDLLEHMN